MTDSSLNPVTNQAGRPVRLADPDALLAIQDFGPYAARFEFDPTYGYSLEQLLALHVAEDEPEDFNAFWADAHARNEALDLEIEFREMPLRSASHRLREVYFKTLGRYRVGAWLCEPRKSRNLQRVEIWGHGYGGREAPDFASFSKDAIQLFVCAPGFHLSVCPERVPSQCSALHVLCGIHRRETYILLPCAAAFWSAARLMENLYPDLPIVYRGTSFGGGIGTLMLPWEPRFRAAEINQPTFGFHAFRLAHRSYGSAESVRRVAELAVPVSETLRYYDAVFAARRVRVPVVVGVCAFDPCVPPPGQFAVANAFSDRLRTLSLFSFGHCDFGYPGSEMESLRHQENLRRLFV